ncbi:ATP-dependent metallopeptidase FtsH/Yme1/Tma family protein [Candidatus Azambacteria bacterium]|nr:ATP-dependent metallopeptidase FtsH/Yme1/Tma family protein [Candidatus Azambacteria bacterium]
MKLLTKNLLYAALAFILLSAMFSFFRTPSEKIEEVALSQLATQINEGKVAQVAVEGNNLNVVLVEGDKKEIAKKENEASLTDSLKNYGVDPEKLRTVRITVKEPSGALFWFGTIFPFVLPFLLVGLLIWFMFRQAQKGSLQAFSFIKSKARMAGPAEKVTFADVAGLKEAKEELREIVDFLRNPKKFLDIGAKIPRGVLLMGPPGTGKTLLARAVAGEAGVPFFHISGSEFVEMFVGVGASRVRDTFATAKKNAPAILFIDELDAIGRHRGAGLGGGHDEREQTLNQILVEMDGFEHETQVIVMAATNRPDILDPALLRPGRFDRRVLLEEPDINDREHILRIHAKGKPFAKDVNLRLVAERTPGFSGADLANIMNEAAILAARRNKSVVFQQELLESIEKVLRGPERKSHILSVKEKEITAYHEAGHALVAASLPSTDPVHKISIISRGRAGGYTLKLPLEDRHLHTRTEFLSDLAVMLGGFTAEQIVFRELTTGASNDLEKATELARRIVTRFGMSDKLGPMTFGGKEEMIFLGREIHENRNYSEAVAQEIDKEVRRLITNAHRAAQKVIRERRQKLNEIAKRLIEKETIEKDEFAAMMKQ